MKEFKYLKKHKALATPKKEEKSVNENVLVVNDGELFKVSKVVDIPKKLINAVLKKAKEETGKDPKVFWNEVSVADEIVKYIINTYLNADSLPASILMGDTSLGMASGEELEDETGEGEEEIAGDLELSGEETTGEEGAESGEEAVEGEKEETSDDGVPSLDDEASEKGTESSEEAEEASEEEV